MKRSVLLMIVVLIVSSCSFFIYPKVTFCVKNETSKDLELLFFHKSTMLDSIFIKNGERYVSSQRYRPGGDDFLTPFNIDTDSLVIRFEDGKILQYYCDGIIFFKNYDKCHFEKNLMDFDTGTASKKTLSDNTTKVITFEEADYDQAVFP